MTGNGDLPRFEIPDEYRVELPDVAEREIADKKRRRRTLWLVLIAFAVLALVAFLFWRAGLFDEPTDDSSTRVLVAVLVLLGVFVTETVGVLGLLLKDSVDQKTADLQSQELRQAALEQQRNYVLAVRDADRLRVDVAIRAVDLIGTPDGALADRRQVGGALLALVSLDQMDLALGLLGDLWTEGADGDSASVSETVAWEVLKRAIRPDCRPLQQNSAAYMTRTRAHTICSGKGGNEWPIPSPAVWPDYLGRDAQLSLVVAAIVWAADEVRSEYNQVSAIAVLYAASQQPLPYLVCAAIRALKALEPWIDSQFDGENAIPTTMANRLSEDGSSGAIVTFNELRAWVVKRSKECTEMPEISMVATALTSLQEAVDESL